MNPILAEFRAMLISAEHCPECLNGLSNGVCSACRYDARDEFLEWEESEARNYAHEDED